MTLIPIKGLRVPSQNTNLLGGVAQILLYPRPSLCLTDVGLFIQPKSQQLSHARTKDGQMNGQMDKISIGVTKENHPSVCFDYKFGNKYFRFVFL